MYNELQLHRLAHRRCIRCGAKRGLSKVHNGKRVRARVSSTWLTCDKCREKDRLRKLKPYKGWES